jgi:E3 ubiquitin-protein ligase listerin
MHIAKPGEECEVASSILPNQSDWRMALELFLALPPRLSTAITSPLGGIVYIIETEASSSLWEKLERIPRDFDHSSCAFRLAHYVINFLSSSSIMKFLNTEEQETLFYYLPMAIQLIDDDLNVQGCNGIIGSETSKSHEELMEVVHEGWALVHHWISIIRPDSSENICVYWKQKLATLRDFSPESYRVGQAFVRICSEAAILGTNENMASQIDTGNEFRTLNVICAAALIAAHTAMTLLTPTTKKLCNELVADATGMNFESNYREGMSAFFSFSF